MSKNKSLTVAVFARRFREKFQFKLPNLSLIGTDLEKDARILKLFDDCLRESLLEELDKRDKEENE